MKYKLILKKLLSLNSTEQNKILNYILQLLYPKYFANNHKCPYCNNSHINKNGKNKNTQRYLCKQCHKSFIMRTNTPVYYSKKQHLLLISFLECLVNQFSIRKTAKLLNISNTTSFVWRHKILNYINTCDSSCILTGTIQCKSLFFNENKKGNHNKIKYVNKRNNFSELLIPTKVPIIAALDNKDNVIINTVPRDINTFINSINAFSIQNNTNKKHNNNNNNNKHNNTSKKHNNFLTISDFSLKKNMTISHYSKNLIINIMRRNNCKITEIDLLNSFVGKVKKDSTIVTNNIPHISSYSTFISHLSLKNALNVFTDTIDNVNDYNLSKINNITNKIYHFFTPYRGVATKYLNNYFSLFKAMYEL